MEGEGPGNLSMSDLPYVVTPHIKSRTYTRLILHSALATKVGQAPTERYTERMRLTQAIQAMIPKGYQVTNVKMTQNFSCSERWHYLEFHHLYYSYPLAVMFRTWIMAVDMFTGRTDLFSETCFRYNAVSYFTRFRLRC